MKYKKILIIFILLFIHSNNAQQRLEFKVYMQKQAYLEGESIEIGRSIINTIARNQQSKGRVSILLRDESTKELVQPSGPFGNWFYAEDKKMNPSEGSYRIIDLTDLFGSRYSLAGYHHILKAGLYSATFSYQENDVLIQDTSISFRVDVPIGEDLTVLNSLIEISEHFKGAKIYSEELKALHEAHPQSIYNPVILKNLHTVYKILLEDSLETLKCGKELIEKYPWSSKGQFILDDLLKKLPEKTERIEYLNKIIPKASNSPMQKLLERKLKVETEK